ncbi:hypothetical protein FS837_012879 [Tulasnella sp. UAMH 9824]|nr:hypothetical protein FS837_012879 [Tulasnella sp. UAMH 9824]
MLVAGQLVVHTQDGSTQNTRHLDCLSKDQKRTARKRVKGPGDLPGFKNLRADDKKKVREVFGLDEDTQSVQGGQNNKGSRDEKTDAKGKGTAKAPERGPQGNAPGSSRQHLETRPISPAQSQSWYDNTPSWDDPEPPKPSSVAATVGGWKGREGQNKQEGRRNAPPETRVQPVPPPAAAPQQASGPNRSKQAGNQDFGNRNPPAPNVPEITPPGNSPVLNPSPPQAAAPAPPKTGIDPAVLMRLELEDKEAEARLVEAELLLAETRVRVETARRAVVAQKLLMARAGVSPTI